MSLADIRKRADAATKGPWRWYGNLGNHEVYLGTPDRGRVYIMRFVRWGMRGAQPLFQRPGKGNEWGGDSMVAANEVPIFEVAPDAVSAYDPKVYRKDIIGLRNPDAQFIAHARQDVDLLLAVAEAAAELVRSPGACAAESVRKTLAALEAA